MHLVLHSSQTLTEGGLRWEVRRRRVLANQTRLRLLICKCQVQAVTVAHEQVIECPFRSGHSSITIPLAAAAPCQLMHRMTPVNGVIMINIAFHSCCSDWLTRSISTAQQLCWPACRTDNHRCDLLLLAGDWAYLAGVSRDSKCDGLL